jgi:hypothetical protein
MTASLRLKKNLPEWAIALMLFGLALIPRVMALDAYVATDEAKWILRSAHFFTALLTGDYSAAASQAATPDVEVLAPAVTTMWSGVAGLTAKYYATGVSLPLADWLAAMPYAHPEQVPLDFYPWLRFPTVIITSLFIVAFYGLARLLLADRPVALTAAILLALDPFFVNYSRVIHHDALVTVFTILSLLTFMVWLNRPHPGWLALSGVAFGLALLTKPTALLLLAVIGLRLMQHLFQTRRRSILGWGLVWAMLALLTFILCWPALWQDPAGTINRLVQTSSTGASGDNGRSLLPALIPNRLPELGVLFYPVNFVLSWGILPTIGLILFPLVWRRDQVNWSPSTRPTLLWLLGYSLLLMLALMPLSTRDIRYFMPSWPALMLLAAFGLSWLRWLKPGPVLVISAILLAPYYPYYITYYNPLVLGHYLAPRLTKVGGGVGLNEAARYLNTVSGPENPTVATYLPEAFKPYYHGPSLTEHKSGAYADYVVNYLRQIQNQYPSAEHLAYFAARPPAHTVRLNGIDYAAVYLEPEPRFTGGIAFDGSELVGQTLDSRYAQPGETHQLTLLWRAPMERASLSPVELEARDAAGKIWLTGAGPLIDPAGPSAVEGRYPLALPADLPRGDYALWASLGGDGSWQQFGELPVHTMTPPVEIQRPVDINFNDYMRLAGFNLSPAAPGQPLDLTLYWHALKPMAYAYTTFVHLLDKSGNVIAQTDLVPGHGDWPTTTWLPGEWLTDTIPLSLPADLPPGDYDLLIGWYYWETGERLPVLVEGTDDQTVSYLTTVTIQ